MNLRCWKHGYFYCFLVLSSHHCVFFCYPLPTSSPSTSPTPSPFLCSHLLSFIHPPPPISAQRGRAPLCLICRVDVSVVRKLAACEDVDSLLPLRLTDRQKRGKTNFTVPNFLCLTLFFFPFQNFHQVGRR